MATTSAQSALAFRISPGNNHDAPEGRLLLEEISSEYNHYLAMDRAYEDNATRELAEQQGFVPVVSPKSNRKDPWDYDNEIYKQRNEVERFFLRLKKRFRRVFTRYDKLDVVFTGVITLAMIFDAILC